jgi:hypothetical protein
MLKLLLNGCEDFMNESWEPIYSDANNQDRRAKVHFYSYISRINTHPQVCTLHKSNVRYSTLHFSWNPRRARQKANLRFGLPFPFGWFGQLMA